MSFPFCFELLSVDLIISRFQLIVRPHLFKKYMFWDKMVRLEGIELTLD